MIIYITIYSSNINEVIKTVLNLLFIYLFFYEKISQAQKSTKKYKKHQRHKKHKNHKKATREKHKNVFVNFLKSKLIFIILYYF